MLDKACYAITSCEMLATAEGAMLARQSAQHEEGQACQLRDRAPPRMLLLLRDRSMAPKNIEMSPNCVGQVPTCRTAMERSNKLPSGRRLTYTCQTDCYAVFTGASERVKRFCVDSFISPRVGL